MLGDRRVGRTPHRMLGTRPKPANDLFGAGPGWADYRLECCGLLRRKKLLRDDPIVSEEFEARVEFDHDRPRGRRTTNNVEDERIFGALKLLNPCRADPVVPRDGALEKLPLGVGRVRPGRCEIVKRMAAETGVAERADTERVIPVFS